MKEQALNCLGRDTKGKHRQEQRDRCRCDDHQERRDTHMSHRQSSGSERSALAYVGDSRIDESRGACAAHHSVERGGTGVTRYSKSMLRF
jgi:hypothetical protein